jgi:HEAT repeat protein
MIHVSRTTSSAFCICGSSPAKSCSGFISTVKAGATPLPSDLTAADARPLAEKLCSALNHPEGETAVRAAWILGERRENQAVPALIRAVETATDGFVVESAVQALAKIGDSRASACLEAAAKHGTIRVRIAARNALHLLL